MFTDHGGVAIQGGESGTETNGVADVNEADSETAVGGTETAAGGTVCA